MQCVGVKKTLKFGEKEEVEECFLLQYSKRRDV